jgi:hypothetical protein
VAADARRPQVTVERAGEVERLMRADLAEDGQVDASRSSLAGVRRAGREPLVRRAKRLPGEFDYCVSDC